MSRFGKFAGVGAMGWAVQVGAVSTLTCMGVHYALATAVAVELAILHNFAWHELFTWRDARTKSARAVATRLLRFNASAAAVSVPGNVLVTALAIEYVRLPAPVANTLAVVLLSCVNYAAARWWIFAV